MKGKLPESLAHLSEATDEQLMAAYQKGCEEAFMLLFEKYSARIYGFLSARVQDRFVKDEVFQATFLKLHHSRQSYDPQLPFAPWLFTICRSAWVDTLRGRSRVGQNEVLNEDLSEIAGPLTSDLETMPLPDLDSLPASQRQALELRYAEGLSFEEIAARLNTTPENTRQLISRATRKLKALVQKGAR